MTAKRLDEMVAGLYFYTENVLGEDEVCLGNATASGLKMVEAHGFAVYVKGVIGADVFLVLGGALDVDTAA